MADAAAAPAGTGWRARAAALARGAAPAPAAPAPALAAEALGARLPPLVVAAERVAATVLQGVHGRRRSGTGDAFWQFRPYVAGDAAARVDWRQSARTDRLYVRETEWEAAQTVLLWRDPAVGLDWSSAPGLPTKRARAELLLLALAALLLRGGERVRLAGAGRSFAGRAALPELAAALAAGQGPADAAAAPRHARAVLVGDFLAPLAGTAAAVSALAARPAGGHLLQVLDPAEETLPYAGRVRFEAGGAEPVLIPRVEGVRARYVARLAAHRAGLSGIAAGAGWGFATHRTDRPPETALLALWQALARR